MHSSSETSSQSLLGTPGTVSPIPSVASVGSPLLGEPHMLHK